MAFGFLKLLARFIDVSRSRRQLASLSDEGLRDIGLSRRQVETEIARPPWDSAGWDCASFKNSPYVSYGPHVGCGNVANRKHAPLGNSFRT